MCVPVGRRCDVVDFAVHEVPDVGQFVFECTGVVCFIRFKLLLFAWRLGWTCLEVVVIFFWSGRWRANGRAHLSQAKSCYALVIYNLAMAVIELGQVCVQSEHFPVIRSQRFFRSI